MRMERQQSKLKIHKDVPEMVLIKE